MNTSIYLLGLSRNKVYENHLCKDLGSPKHKDFRVATPLYLYFELLF